MSCQGSLQRKTGQGVRRCLVNLVFPACSAEATLGLTEASLPKVRYIFVQTTELSLLNNTNTDLLNVKPFVQQTGKALLLQTMSEKLAPRAICRYTATRRRIKGQICFRHDKDIYQTQKMKKSNRSTLLEPIMGNLARSKIFQKSTQDGNSVEIGQIFFFFKINSPSICLSKTFLRW